MSSLKVRINYTLMAQLIKAIRYFLDKLEAELDGAVLTKKEEQKGEQ